MERHSFHAMGTEVEVLVETEARDEAAAAFAGLELEFRRLESILTRFDRTSELSRLNDNGVLAAGPELREVVELALVARDRSQGRFDPTVHDAVVAAGYDRSFELIDGSVALEAPAGPAGGGVRVGESLIELDPGVRLDLGGIGKGYAVDRVLPFVGVLGPALVNAGGDLAVSAPLEAGAWPVAVETPTGSLCLGLTSGALATSGSDRRRWQAGEESRHHLIDPKTGFPSESDLLRVTAFGSSAVEAEIRAKSLFLAGEAAASFEAEFESVPAALVTLDGSCRLVGGLR
jgi:thiamine biosynthesis lipoprotein